MNIIEVPVNHKMFWEEFHCEIDNFIYDEFGISFTGDEGFFVYVFFRKGISGTQIQLPYVKVGEKDDDILFYNIELNNSDVCGYSVFCNTNDETYINIGHKLAGIVLRVISYIMSTPRNKVLKPKVSKIPKTENKENSKNKYENENKIFLIDDIVEYVSVNGLNQTKTVGREIQCPCWSVRGHYRHYKSGKIVFINNYKKGKERANAEPKSKTYTV